MIQLMMSREEKQQKLEIRAVESEFKSHSIFPVELENRVELKSKLQISRVELKMCEVRFVLQLMISREEKQQRSRVSVEQSNNMCSS